MESKQRNHLLAHDAFRSLDDSVNHLPVVRYWIISHDQIRRQYFAMFVIQMSNRLTFACTLRVAFYPRKDLVVNLASGWQVQPSPNPNSAIVNRKSIRQKCLQSDFGTRGEFLMRISSQRLISCRMYLVYISL